MSDFVLPYQTFIFEDYFFDHDTKILHLKYSFDGVEYFEETVEFYGDIGTYDREIIDRLSFYYWIVAGTSYYKTFYAPQFKIMKGDLTSEQARFFNMTYLGGLSQYIYENALDYKKIAQFSGSGNVAETVVYDGEGTLLMESGGKDSILSAELLMQNQHDFTPWYMGSSGKYPSEVFEIIGKDHLLAKRTIDLPALSRAKENGGLNGHVPFSAIYAGAALIHGVLTSKKYVLASNEASADEGNVEIDGLTINHQFSKMYQFELDLQDYIHTNITTGLEYASLLRPFSEVKVAQLFAKLAWAKYKDHYSSCNLANYKQGRDGGVLKWDGVCPKCANTFLLFAPYVPQEELISLFSGKNIMQDMRMTETFKQLLGQSDIKPFECVATFEEMEYVYNLAHAKSDEYTIEGVAPEPVDFDPDKLYAYQKTIEYFITPSSL